jgi:amino acid transporter
MCVVILALGLTLSLRDLAQTTSALTLAAFALVNLSLIIIKLRPEQPKDIFRVPAAVPVLGFASSVSLLVFELARQLGAFPG